MSIVGGDLFEAWRFILATACACYAGVVTLRSAFAWLGLLDRPDRATRLLRSYVAVLALRLRGRRFARELGAIGLYSAILIALLARH